MLADSLSPSISSLPSVEKKITAALTQAQTSNASNASNKVLLILDYPSLLATTPNLTSTALSTLILTLRSHASVHSTLLTTPADGPFLSATQPDTNAAPTPIESESAAFTVQQAHCARSVLSVRELGTGAARDVSGVLRVTKGGKSEDEVKEWEALYIAGRDGGVKIVE
jgi:elongator complex protein 6